MRRHLSLASLLLALLLGAPQAVAAQQFGILGGVNLSDVSDDDDLTEVERRTGFLVGVFGRIGLGEIITFQPEVHYSQKGAKLDVEDEDAELELALSYIDVPLFLSFGFPNSFHAMVGPRLSFEAGCEINVEAEGLDLDLDCDEDDADDFGFGRKSFIVGGAVGLGIDVPLGGINAFIDGRFDVDLESFAENEDDDVKNRSIQIVAGIRFGGM